MYYSGFLIQFSVLLQRSQSTIIFKFAQAKLEQKSGVVTIMKCSMPVATMLLFVLAALSFGWASAEESVMADEGSAVSMNETMANATLLNVTNETLMNNTLTNETLNNATLDNESLENASLINESLENTTLSNETLKNLTTSENKTGYFEKVRGRQPTRH